MSTVVVAGVVVWLRIKSTKTRSDGRRRASKNSHLQSSPPYLPHTTGTIRNGFGHDFF